MSHLPDDQAARALARWIGTTAPRLRCVAALNRADVTRALLG